MNHALERAKGGSCLPQELQSRQTTLKRSIKQLDQQQTRLMDAYLASVIELTELQRRRAELAQHQATLAAQQRQLDAVAKQHLDVAALADGIERFCSQVRAGLLDATFEERRALVELLIDRVIMTNGEVEIRYVIPTSPMSIIDGFVICDWTISIVRHRQPATRTSVASGVPSG